MSIVKSKKLATGYNTRDQFIEVYEDYIFVDGKQVARAFDAWDEDQWNAMKAYYTENIIVDS